MGRCQVEGELSDDWQACAVFDVSTLGVGLDLPHSGPSDLEGRRVWVHLELGPSVDMTVAGEVRNAESAPDGIVRAGIEFVGLTDTERAIVSVLEQRAASRSKSLSPR
jgi:PilZ domain